MEGKQWVIGFCRADDLFGVFSNFAMTSFTVDSQHFCSSEQYIMYRKAMLFDDTYAARQIMKSSVPSIAKRLGRKVKGFDEMVWREHRDEIALTGLYAKFSQNARAEDLLLRTGESILAECSVTDRIWGIGLDIKDWRVEYPHLWRGSNLQGQYLVQVRNRLQEELKN